MARHEPDFAKVADFMALARAARRAAEGHHRSPEVCSFLLNLEPEALALERELLAGTFRPAPYRTFYLRDPKPRTISAAAFRDRVVHHALCSEIEPVLEAGALASSFACRRGKGVLAAIGHTRRLARQHRYVLKLDVRHFFETLSHAVLARMLARRIADERILGLVATFIAAGAPGSEPARGLPIGNLYSQHFANFYLGPLDRLITRGLRADGHCRYMDDTLVFADSKAALWAMYSEIDDFVRTRLDLVLKPEITRVLPVSEGIPFLGFIVFPGTVRFDPARARRWRRRIRELQQALDGGRLSEEDAQRAADSLVGWARHADTLGFRRSWVIRHG